MLEESKGSRSRSGALYVSYLLRMWFTPEDGAREGKWLASVESPLTREQHHFTDLESLFAFLRAMAGRWPWQRPTRQLLVELRHQPRRHVLHWPPLPRVSHCLRRLHQQVVSW